MNPSDGLVNTRLRAFGTSIFAEVSAAAAAHGAINLGQGFPDEDGPEPVRRAAAEAAIDGPNQYAPLAGLPALRRAVAAWLERTQGVEVDPDQEVTVVTGATGGIADAMLGLLEPGDGVILIEPWYDSYPASVAMAGGRCRYAMPAAPDYRIDRAVLESAIDDGCRVLVVNSPHNPTGRVLDETEWDAIESFVIDHDLVLVSDEVYEALTYDAPHRSPLGRPRLRDRTIVVSSIGKSFSLTGWKIGWTVAVPALTEAVRAAHQFTIFSVATPLQIGAAAALEMPDETFAELRRSHRERRDMLVEGLDAAGLHPIVPQGTYFVLADVARIGVTDDRAFCDRLLREVGVAAIPTSAFHHDGRSGPIRFAFCKRPEVLAEAISRLAGAGRLAP
jgi:N-succinyldiaminopimelate aminotransferase